MNPMSPLGFQPPLDKYGNPVTREKSWKLMEDMAYRRVGDTVTPTGWRVSTVWMGSFGSLFETMVFSVDPGNAGIDFDAARYLTLMEAETGHAKMVLKWSDPYLDVKMRLGAPLPDPE
jgi:hypothetical protein